MLAAGQLQTKYLNPIFVVERGDYVALGSLLIVVASIDMAGKRLDGQQN